MPLNCSIERRQLGWSKNNLDRLIPNRYPPPSMHEQTRRFIAVAVFYLFGPILTLTLIGVIIVRKLPDNARCYEHALAVQTGLNWSVDKVEYLNPHTVRLHTLRLLDDTAAVLIVPVLDISISKAVYNVSVPAAIVKFDGYSSAQSAAVVQTLLQKILSRFEYFSESPVQISIEKLVITSAYALTKDGEKFDTLRFVQGNISRSENTVRCDWTFKIKDVSETETEQLSFVQSLGHPTLDIIFQTGKQTVPCGFAGVFCPVFQQFSDGRFIGEFRCRIRGGDAPLRRFTLRNVSLKNLNIAALVRPYTPFAVSGTIADLTLAEAEFGDNNFTAAGHLKIANGSLDTRLFHRIVDNFHLTVQPQISEHSQSEVPFTACAVHFRLQPDGAAFWADTLWKDALFYLDNAAVGKYVVTMPRSERSVPMISYRELLSLFAPDTAPVVPFTPGLKKIFTVLPAE